MPIILNQNGHKKCNTEDPHQKISHWKVSNRLLDGVVMGGYKLILLNVKVRTWKTKSRLWEDRFNGPLT